MHDEKFYAERCLRTGARGYVTKPESPQRIVTAIREVLNGKMRQRGDFLRIHRQFISESPAAQGSAVGDLSGRELEVFKLIGSGLETRKIAENLNVNVKTVQTYCARIKQKLGLPPRWSFCRKPCGGMTGA